MNSEPKLNLGCGAELLDGWTNVDWRAPEADVTWDLNQFPYPFDDESASEIRMFNCLEHLDDHCKVMREIHRILKPGGTAHFRVPYFTSLAVPSDPSHRRGYSVRTFYFFTDRAEYPLVNFRFTDYRHKLVFLQTYRIQRLLNAVVGWYANRCTAKYETGVLARLFPAWSLDVWLTK